MHSRGCARRRRDQGLDDIEITGFAALLAAAGSETVTKLVGNAVVLFARNPDQWRKILDDRSQIPNAVEEVFATGRPRSTRDVSRSARASCTG